MLLSDACLSDVCLVCRVHRGITRTERPRKTKIGTEVAHVTRDSDTTFKVKGHQAALISCSRHYIIYMDDTTIYATAQSEPLPVLNIHGARHAGHHRHKACMGCSVRRTGAGHIAWIPTQLVTFV